MCISAQKAIIPILHCWCLVGLGQLKMIARNYPTLYPMGCATGEVFLFSIAWNVMFARPHLWNGLETGESFSKNCFLQEIEWNVQICTERFHLLTLHPHDSRGRVKLKNTLVGITWNVQIWMQKLALPTLHCHRGGELRKITSVQIWTFH